MTIADAISAHEPHQWRQVGLCVWCVDCNLRLYNGEIPERKDPGRAARQQACDHDWDDEFGMGFYSICRKCGFKEWFE